MAAAAVGAVLVSAGGATFAPRAARAAGFEGSETAVVKASSEAGFVDYEDLEFAMDLPDDFQYVPIQQAKRPNDVGPAPPVSPVRARFDSADHSTVVSVILRPATSLRPMLMQVNNISDFGTPLEAAELLLPKGSVLLSSSQVRPRNRARIILGLISVALWALCCGVGEQCAGAQI